jgi:hypothetical protein
MLDQNAPIRGTETRTLAHWRLAGGLALAHVVLMFTGLSQEVSPVHGDAADKVLATFAGASFDRVLVGGFVESLGFIVLLPALVFLARAVGRGSEAGRWAGHTGLAAGIAYVAVTLASGFPPGAAALYGAQHGADAQTVAVVDEIRIYAFFLSVLLLGLHAISVGIAALADRRFTRWVGYGGVLAGIATLAGVAAGAVNVASMVWIVWWVGVAVCLLRGPGRGDLAA